MSKVYQSIKITNVSRSTPFSSYIAISLSKFLKKNFFKGELQGDMLLLKMAIFSSTWVNGISYTHTLHYYINTVSHTEVSCFVRAVFQTSVIPDQLIFSKVSWFKASRLLFML